jgi:hypothetical protein
MLIPFGILSAAATQALVAAVAGYFAGGWNGSTGFSTVDKFAFPSETRTTLATGLSVARDGVAGMADSQVAGYIAAGGILLAPKTLLINFLLLMIAGQH